MNENQKKQQEEALAKAHETACDAAGMKKGQSDMKPEMGPDEDCKY